MAVKLVRANSDSPNVQNYDDARLFRYACGGYDGVVKNYANECGYEISGNNFIIKSGEFVIDGWQGDVDGSNVVIAVDVIAGTQYYVIYAEIDLQVGTNQKALIKASYNTAYYPPISRGDDLTTNTSGVARIELYRFEVSSGVISNVIKKFKTFDYGWVKNSESAIKLTGTIESGVLATTQASSDNSQKVATTAFVHNTTGLVLSMESRTIKIRVGRNVDASDSVDLYRDGDTPFTDTVLMARPNNSFDDSLKRIIGVNFTRQILVRSNRYDYKYAFVRIDGIEDMNLYPRQVMFISNNYQNGVVTCYGDRTNYTTFHGETYSRYNLFDDGYDFVNNAYVITQLFY